MLANGKLDGAYLLTSLGSGRAGQKLRRDCSESKLACTLILFSVSALFGKPIVSFAALPSGKGKKGHFIPNRMCNCNSDSPYH